MLYYRYIFRSADPGACKPSGAQHTHSTVWAKALWINVPGGIRPTAAKVPAGGRWQTHSSSSFSSSSNLSCSTHTRTDTVLCALCWCIVFAVFGHCGQNYDVLNTCSPVPLDQANWERDWGREKAWQPCEGSRHTCVFYIWIWSKPERRLAIEIWMGGSPWTIRVNWNVIVLKQGRGGRQGGAAGTASFGYRGKASCFSHFQLQLSSLRALNEPKNKLKLLQLTIKKGFRFKIEQKSWELKRNNNYR